MSGKEPSLFGGFIERESEDDSGEENEDENESTDGTNYETEDGDEDEDEDDEDDEDDEEEQVIPVRKSVNRLDILQAKLADLNQIDMKSPWERLVINSKEPFEIKDINDDLDREAQFYKAALDAVEVAAAKFKSDNVQWQRPIDYFGEMLKTDEHMEKIKNKLVREDKETHQKIERRKQREQKKYGKRAQVEQQQQKAKKRKLEYELVKKWRKDRKQGKAGEFNIEEMEKEIVKANDKKRKRDERDEKKQSKSTKKAKKFGFGPKKNKKNTAESSAQARGWTSKKTFGGKKK